MQTIPSQYGREDLVVSDEIPTVALREILGWTHVSTPDADVEAMVRERAQQYGYSPEQTEQTIKAALWIHGEHQAEYRWVMSGCR